MTGLAFLAHKQLHEDIFSFLDPDAVLNHRTIHSECDAVVRRYAESRIQDVLGQELVASAPTEYQDIGRTHVLRRSHEAARTEVDMASKPRTVDTSLVKLNAQVLDRIIASSEAGVRNVCVELIRGAPCAVNHVISLICRGMTPESTRQLHHLDVGGTAGAVPAEFLFMVSQNACNLASLSTAQSCASSPLPTPLDSLLTLRSVSLPTDVAS